MSAFSVTSSDLVTDICNGNREAEARLVGKYWQQVLYILERRCRDPELARDICQETFLVLLEKFRRQTLEDPEQLAAYIQKTAVNILIAHIRKEARRQTYPDSDLIEEYVDSRASPLSELEQRRISASVRDSILAMKNPRDRDVLYRYYIEEQDKDEICSSLGLDFRHFDKVISRARTRLKEQYLSSPGGAEASGAEV